MRKNLISMVISGKDPSRILMDKATPRNSTGLCNQIFQFINTLFAVKQSGEDFQIYFDHFSRDLIHGDHMRCSEIINISEMNRLYGWDLKEIEDYRGGEAQVFPIGYVFMAEHNDKPFFAETAKRIIFTDKYENVAKRLIREKGLEGTEVNLVHLRIDEDCRRHILGSKGQQKLDEYIEGFRKAIKENISDDKKLVLLLEETDHEMVKELQEKYEVIFLSKQEVEKAFIEENGEEIKGRELFALVDLLFGKNLKVGTYIYAENETNTSSFSVMLKYLNDYKKMLSA